MPTQADWQPQVYPLSIRDVSPGEGYIRLEVPQVPGKPPEGMHTGGVWYHPDYPDHIFKPLDGRPFANADCHVETREAEILMLLGGMPGGMPGFPRNWHVERWNGRRWLVRNRAYTCPPYEPKDLFTLEHVLTIEQGLRALNTAGWILNDRLNVALDYDSYEPFILDLSSAAPESVAHFCNDEWRWTEWVKEIGSSAGLLRLRRSGRDLVQGRESRGRWPAGFRYVYASRNRPLSWLWMEKPVCDAELEHTMPKPDLHVHTWLICTQLLDPDYLQRYELTFAWAPWGPQQPPQEGGEACSVNPR